MADRLKLAIMLYMLIGLVLALTSLILLYMMYTNLISVSGFRLYLVFGLVFFMLFLGLHWLIVGVSSLRGG